MAGGIARAVMSLAVGVLLCVGWQGGERVDRRPLEGRGTPFESPRTWQMRERIDPATGHLIRYDPRPRISTVDPKAGLYDLVWIGQDGEPKSVRYQRPDAVVVVVRADVRSVPNGLLEYMYVVENSSQSGQELRGFEVQTFAADVTPIVDRLAGGWMGPGLLGSGRWYRFWVGRDFSPRVGPGESGVFRLTSRALPGLVECSVDGGSGGYKGVGDEMPAELVDLLPGYEAWPRGKTVGPVERLSALSPPARTAQLLEWLPDLQRLGWMIDVARRRYESVLARGSVPDLLPDLDDDLKQESIAIEVAVIVRGLAR